MTSPVRVVRSAAGLIPVFGSEGFLAPWPNPAVWHHEGLTRDAAREAGWSRAAAADLAFHATYVDHYLLNPLWRLAGGRRRLRAAGWIRDDLETLHFDDLTTPEEVSLAWRRYLSGTLCALLWSAVAPLPSAGASARRTRVACARGAIGLGLHAVQDFYSHSTWIDVPTRRTATWDEWSGSVTDLRTGAVTGDGVPRHGEIGLRPRVAHPASVPLRAGFGTPSWLTGIGDGINLDTRWQAPTGVAGRGGRQRLGLDAGEAFEVAIALARRSSVQSLRAWGGAMKRAGLGDFWAEVIDAGDSTDTGAMRLPRQVRTAGALVLEDPRLRPHTFLATGQHAPRPAAEGPWFVRVEAETVGGRGVTRVLGPRQEVPTSIRAPRDHRGRVTAAVAFRRADPDSDADSDSEVRFLHADDDGAGRVRLEETARAGATLSRA